ncbi:hypothetical protein MIMGU_mgv1a025631mg [Erythranthe guttata]|uniref:Uncharacterized protein n=1 Tax=Erythranthe guttata TaxID=4155 RepID=A0A022QSK3_ERYGU|nr:hypothetical protein MIMGU_mgv1a025631mg [Erythranthe guttata]
MTSRQQLLDSLTAHISLYHSQIPRGNPNPAPGPNTRPAVLRWFSSLSVHHRRAHLTTVHPSVTAIIIQMKEKLQSQGYGRFIILPDLPQNDDSALPTLCYRKSDGLLSRFAEFDPARRAIRESVELFSSTEGEGGDSKGDGFPRLDAACVSEGLVEDVSRFVGIMDEVTNGEFLRGGEEAEMAGEWAEMGWLKAKGYYSLEEFVVNRMEVALRLAWLNSNSGKKRGVKLKERMNAAGVAANLFWRKKGCVDWWDKLDDSVKKKVYFAYLGKAARSLVVSALSSAAQNGGHGTEKLFYSSLDCVNSIADIILRKLRELLMVISLDCTKIELLGEGNKNSHAKKSTEKHVANNRKKKGKNRNKKSNPVPRPCQDDSKPIDPTKEPVKGVNNGKLRGAPRKNRKERKKLKSSGSNGSEVGCCQSKLTEVAPASVSCQEAPSTSVRTSGCSTFANVSKNAVSHFDRPDANPDIGSNLSTDNAAQYTETTVDESLNFGAKAIEPVVEYNDKSCTRMIGSRSYASSCKGKQMKGGEPEVKKPSMVQEQGSLSFLRVGATIHTHRPAATDRLHLDVGHHLQNHFHHSFLQTLQVRNSPIDISAYNGVITRPSAMSLDWPPTVRGVNRLVPSVTCNYDSEFISRRQSSFQQSVAAQSVQCGAATSEDERTISSEMMDFHDVPNSQELIDDHDRSWMSEEELETHAISGVDYNQYFGGGVMYWDSSDHPGTSFSRPPSLCSDDSSWAWREADMNRAVDDMVAFSSSYSTNGLTSPSTASFCSPFDPLGPGALGYVIPGGEISSKVLHSSSTMAEGGTEESVSGSISNISGDGEMKTVDSLPYPILRPIIIPSMSRERSRSEFKYSYDHKSPCVPLNRREQPRIKRPPSPVVLCVPRAPRPPPPSPVSDSRKHRGFPTVRSGSSSPRQWGVKGWLHDGVNFEEACMPIEGSEVVWPSWRNKGLSARQLTQPLAGTLLQDRLIAISQLARDQEHPDVIFPLQPPESQNSSTRKASLSLIHDILHDEINYFCKQVAAENLIRKPYINWAVKRVARSLQVLWPRSRTNIYGSNATGLSLPSSDVDLVVCLPPVRNLEPIKEAGILEGRNGIKETCLQIPIIMLVVEVPQDLVSTLSNVHIPKEEANLVASEEGSTFQADAIGSEDTTPTFSKTRNDVNEGFESVRLDISFKSPTHTGLLTTGLVKDLTERFPAVTPLALVLKQFLADRSLDQSYSGGLSSYCLILLITRFLQHEHHHGRPINQNYGSLLMDFLYFFGNVFDPRQMRISVQGSGVYLNRERGCSIDPLYIDDPLFLTNNVGRNCFRIHQCIKAFADAYAMLESELTCLHNDDKDTKPTCKLLPKLIPSIGLLVES